MNWISCTVWILGALLVVATLDRMPDPPAANSGDSHFSTLSCLDHPDGILTAGTLALPRWTMSDSTRISLAGASIPSIRQNVRVAEAADPSPPAVRT